MKGLLVVYTVHERQRDGAKLWTRIGEGIVERDGSITVELHALPANGRLAIREQRPAHAEEPMTKSEPCPRGDHDCPRCHSETSKPTTWADFVGTLARAYLEAPADSESERMLEALLVSTAEEHGIDHERVLESLPGVRAVEEP